MNKGYFGSLFDYDHDGNLDRSERVVDYLAFEDFISESKNDWEDEDEDDYEDNDFD